MFSTSDIVINSSAKSYNRGCDIASREGSVEARSFTSGKQRCDISADVRSSSGIAERFHAYISCDPELSTITDYECNCPAARKFSGMCKHCVALAVSFKSDPSSFMGFSSGREAVTSRSLRAFLETAPARCDLRLDSGTAHLEATFVHDFGKWLLRLDVSAFDARYVVADIAAMGAAIDAQSFHSYGQKLGFVHTPQAFDSQSVGLALFAAELARTNPAIKREAPITEAQVSRLLDSIGDGTFGLVDIATDSKSCSLRVQDGNPDITLRIIEGSDGMFEIVRDDYLIVASTPAHAYVFLDGQAYRCTTDFTPAAMFLHDVYSSADDEIVLSKIDAPSFCANVLPTLERCLSVSFPNSLEALRPREASFSFYLDKTGRGRDEAIECTLKVDYGQGQIALLEPATSDTRNRSKASAAALDGKAGSANASYRDEAEEDAAIELVSEYFDATMRIPLDDEQAAGELLYEGLMRFRSAGEVYTTRDFDRLISDKKARVQIGLSLAGNLIDMDVHASDLDNDELAALLGSYQRHKRFHKLKDGSIASLAQMDLAYLDRMSQDLGISAKQIAKGEIELPTYTAFILDREFAEANRDESFESYIERFENDETDVEPPRSVKATMRGYQVEGLRWLVKLSSIGFGGILADEMGLGKTLQAIAYLAWAKEQGQEGPALVVAPASLVFNWVEELARFAPSLSCKAIDGTKSERRTCRQKNGVDVFVASYDAVRMDVDEFSDVAYSCVILDEAQFIKNHATKTTRAVKRLNAQHRFALTGTPIENRLSEIWSIFDFLMPGFLGTYAQFRRRFEIDILGGDEEVARHFQALVAPFVLRRLKIDVLEDLPEKQEGVVLVSLDGEQRKLYNACEQELRQSLLEQRRTAQKQRTTNAGTAVSDGVKVDVLAELMRLREVALEPSLVYSGYTAGSSKTDAVVELIREAVESNRKSLVFSQFTSYLDILKKRLDEEGLAYYEITGSTPKRARLDLVNDFNANSVPVFLVSLKAGGTGLNLIGASVVIHADPWWNAAAIDQATDRAHRIGQTEMVSVYKVIAKGTIEERILKLQEKKSELAESVVAKTSLSSLSSLTRDELESLLFD